IGIPVRLALLQTTADGSPLLLMTLFIFVFLGSFPSRTTMRLLLRRARAVLVCPSDSRSFLCNAG
ncbi:MAG: hypothetical protein ACJ8J7_01125, partial [Sulfurifustaceae bacterium]